MRDQLEAIVPPELALELSLSRSFSLLLSLVFSDGRGITMGMEATRGDTDSSFDVAAEP